MNDATLVQRAARSAWVGASPGLVSAVAEWQQTFGHERERLGERAVELARPGAVDPRRVAQHATAAALSRVVRVTTGLPGALASGELLREPGRWAERAAVEAFVDQLALSGPAGAEMARLVTDAGALFPEVLRDELERRDIRTPRLRPAEVEGIARRAVGDVRVTGRLPVVSSPASQAHVGELDDGTPVLVRVRRPGVTRALRTDTTLTAALASGLVQMVPEMGGLHPIGFVQLIVRQVLEATDLRFEALDLVELGIVAEELGVEQLVVARPLPGRAAERAVLTELIEGTMLPAGVDRLADPAGALAALASVTLESALVDGIFWADPAPEHLIALPDGRLGVLRVAVLGRLTPELRAAGILLLKSIVTGDAEGQVRAMALAGALPTDVDPALVAAELSASPLLDPMQLLLGGQDALLAALREVVRIMLAHRMRPPVEVGLLLRTVFALGRLSDVLLPQGGGLAAALVPMLPRLPDLLARAEAAVADVDL
ncbi:MAG: AarF/UbiB family protein [Acidimicrobiales bacterium]|nr:AarF/UbiB family protein [Acidimicrobiales bacterium]